MTDAGRPATGYRARRPATGRRDAQPDRRVSCLATGARRCCFCRVPPRVTGDRVPGCAWQRAAGRPEGGYLVPGDRPTAPGTATGRRSRDRAPGDGERGAGDRRVAVPSRQPSGGRVGRVGRRPSAVRRRPCAVPAGDGARPVSAGGRRGYCWGVRCEPLPVVGRPWPERPRRPRDEAEALRRGRSVTGARITTGTPEGAWAPVIRVNSASPERT